MKNLHLVEAPISLLASIIANSNRDPKKKREPYKMEDFFLYEPRDLKNIPTGVYGSAAMALAGKGLLPPWTLFVYKDLKEAADGNPPKLLAYICDDAILLAPMHLGATVRGMLIAKESASKQRRTLTSPCGSKIYTEIPEILGKFVADEGVELTIIS